MLWCEDCYQVVLNFAHLFWAAHPFWVHDSVSTLHELHYSVPLGPAADPYMRQGDVVFRQGLNHATVSVTVMPKEIM
jgi:hypothetical protein